MKPALQCIALVCALATPASAQDSFRTKIDVDLDGAAPDELVEHWQDGQRVLFWSKSDALWVEVFRGQDIVGFVDDPRSYFKRIVADGRQWQWRDVGFVPLIADQAVAAGVASDADFAAAIIPFQNDLASTPENSAANLAYLFRAKSGETLKAIHLATTSICTGGGSVCPLVIIRDGKEPSVVFVKLDLPWGFFEAKDRIFVEYQLDEGVTQIDLDTGAVSDLVLIEPVSAESPPRRPRDAG
ncbi:hypothetical protein [uncultured Tateyamaria sp.]|uniref:hypothetical protein n=1 Tax=uncultured Tateyamaria sp. TaxID=455651 RepID=UPI00261B5652|nr:hypothetical protein [uncultured Tateyamaria sp.]